MFKLYLDENGKPQFDDKGNPLFMQDGGSEPTAINVDGLYDQIRQLGGEAKSHRAAKEEIELKLKRFEGFDPDAAKKALELVKQLDESKLIEAGKVDELKQKAVMEFQQKFDNLNKTLEETKVDTGEKLKAKDQVIHDLLVKNSFSASTFLREKTVLPPDIAYSAFGKHFKVEYQNDAPVVIASDGKGEPLFSQAQPGTYAQPEEAIKLLIEQHPQRDSFMRNATPGGGSGSHPAAGGGRGSNFPKRLTDCKTEQEKIAWLQEHGASAS